MAGDTKTKQSDFGIWEVGFYYSTLLISKPRVYDGLHKKKIKLKIGFEKRAVVLYMLLFQIQRRMESV